MNKYTTERPRTKRPRTERHSTASHSTERPRTASPRAMWKKYRGFSLLEIIVVLAIIGFIMAGVALYISRQLDAKNQRLAASAVVQEMDGIVRFVNTDQIAYTQSQGGKDVHATDVNPLYYTGGLLNGTTGKVVNPVYYSRYAVTKKLGAGYSFNLGIASDTFFYDRRVYYPSAAIYPVNNDLAKAGDHPSIYTAWDSKVRLYFQDEGCLVAGDSKNGNPIYYQQEFLPCHINPMLQNGPLKLDRLDLVNFDGTLDRNPTSATRFDPSGISRVDIFVRYVPETGNAFSLASYYAPIMDALEKLGLKSQLPTQVFVVKQETGAPHKWNLLSKKSGMPITSAANIPLPGDVKKNDVDVLTYADLPLHPLKDNKATYGLLFRFDGSGNFLRTDGSVQATKLCWSVGESKPGPCLTAPDEDTLKLSKGGTAADQLANLQAKNVILQGTEYTDPTNPNAATTVYYTPPQIQYAHFSNTDLSPCFSTNAGHYVGTTADATFICGWPHQSNGNAAGYDLTDANPAHRTMTQINAHGHITVPKQECPTITVNNAPMPLHPRLSVALSSVAALLPRTQQDYRDSRDVFADPARTILQFMKNLNVSDNAGRFMVQVNIDSGDMNTFENWLINGISVSDERSAAGGHYWQFYNPPWMSVQITSWCSTQPQAHYEPVRDDI